MRSLFRRYARRNLRLATMGSIGGAAVAYEVYRRRDINQTTPLLDMIRKDGLSVMSNSVAVATSSSKDDFPVYTREEVAKHTTPETRIWVTFRDGVYDITDFVQAHPGGAQRIMLAAGGQVDPFWLLYQQHYTENVQKLLAPMRIGTLAKDDVPDPSALDAADPYAAEPKRHPALVVRKQKPFNCETPVSLIPDQYITPTALWYCRHHHPVPLVDPEEFTLRVEGEGLRCTDFTLKELREKFPAHKVTMTQQCAGNRRSELHKVRPTQGLLWAQGTISTGEFVGVRVRDVVESCLLNKDDKESVDKALSKIGAQHVHFVAVDEPYVLLSLFLSLSLSHTHIHVQVRRLDTDAQSVE
jgi:sulfite oxidase